MIDALRKLSWHIYDHDALPDGIGWQQLADTIAEAAGALEGMAETRQHLDSVGEAYLIHQLWEAING